MSLYLRVKRQHQTCFLHVEPTDSFATVKKKLGDVSSSMTTLRTFTGHSASYSN